MRSIRAAAAAAGLGAALLAGCLLPPFDAEVSLAYRSARKMTLVSEIGPMYFWRGHEGAGEFYFLPSQTDFTTIPENPAAGHGLLVAGDDYKVRVWYVDTDAAGNAQVWGDRSFLIDSSNANRYNWQVHMLKAAAGSSDYFVLHDWAVAEPVGGGDSGLLSASYGRFVYNLPDDVPSLQWGDLGIPTPEQLVGVSFLPLNDPGQDQISFLTFVAPEYREDRVSVSGPLSPSSLGVSRQVALPGPPPVDSGFYQHDAASGRSALSWYDGSAWVTYTWDAALSPVLLPIGERIDLLLSIGELYHRGEESDTVYGWNGTKKYEFPVGGMRLAGERYVGGVATLFYTLIFWERRDGGDDRMFVRVYTLPTADLYELN